MTNFKEYVENQDKIRERFFKILQVEPRSWRSLAPDIGVAAITIKRFLKDERDVDYVVLLKIEKWLKGKERDYREEIT